MKITDPSITGKTGDIPKATLKAPTAKALLDRLQINPGQTLLAKVFSKAPEATRAGNTTRMLLEVLGQKLPVDTNVPLKTGSLVRIQREANHLRLLEALPADTRQLATQALAQKLPSQHSLESGLKTLASTLKQLSAQPRPTASAPPQASPADLPQNLRQSVKAAMERLFQNIPQQKQLVDPNNRAPQKEVAAIRDWVARSGVFAEAQLARTVSEGKQAPPDNLKTALLNLARVLMQTDVESAATQMRQLRPVTSPELLQQPLQFPQPLQAPPQGGKETMDSGQMLRLLAGMLNRITTQQLHTQTLSLPTPQDGGMAPPTPTWLLEIPWFGNSGPKVAELRLERHELEKEQEEEEKRKKAKKRTAQWRLALALDLDNLGPVFFDLAVEPGSVAATIWAQRETTWRLVREETPRFERSLTNLGLTVKRLDCQQGYPHRPRTQLEHRLVDEKA
ncbi:flagellar hook-length control protein FliK [Marinobacteraceae bacterium S3BR75-40.1]